jgi:glycosyltransferase involved in cell wall biosynthesis
MYMESSPIATRRDHTPRQHPQSQGLSIVYITSRFPFGKSEAFFIPEVHELQRQGHTVHVAPKLPGGTITHTSATHLIDPNWCRSLYAPDLLLGALRTLLRHPWRTLTVVLSVLLQPTSLRNLGHNIAIVPKALWLAHQAERAGVDHLHGAWSVAEATMALIAGEIAGIPWSFTGHRGDILSDNLLRFKVRTAAFSRWISEASLEMAAAGAGNLPANAHLLHLGVPLPEADVATRRFPAAGEPVTLICTALLNERKGHAVLLDALAQLVQKGHNLRLLLAGDGPLRADLEQKAVSLGLGSRVEFLGLVPNARLMEIYSSGDAHMAVLTSYHEGIPVALMEAMAHGLPVVATDAGGVRELLAGGAGLMAPVGDADAVAALLDYMLTQPTVRATIAQLGRERVQQEFNVRSVVARLAGWMQASQ